MGLYWKSIRLLGLAPKVRGRKLFLRARTSLPTQMLSLFSYNRRVTVDVRGKVIVIKRRRLWFSSLKTVIPFSRVRYIECREGGVGAEWDRALSGHESDSQLDCYTVVLMLHKPDERFPLNTLAGSAMVRIDPRLKSHVPGVDKRSRARYVDALAGILGVPYGRPTEIDEGAGAPTFTCEQCGRPSPINMDYCIYCSTPWAGAPR